MGQGNANEKITHIDAMLLNARIDGVEKRLDGQQAQFTEVISKMAVFEANLKAAGEEARRATETQQKAFQNFKEFAETQSLAVLQKLEGIADALGLDGTQVKADRLRDIVNRLQRADKRKEVLVEKVTESVTIGVIKWTLVFIAVSVIMRVAPHINMPAF